jgi:DNA repair exonuclease SbcCD nuclease subunit
VIDYDGLPIAFVPWICTDNQEDTFKFIKETTAQVLMGHLDLIGFEMYRGSVAYGGYNAKIFDKFDVVCSGHFHHKSTRGNINYLGTPYEMSWSDYGDPKGFHVFDTNHRKLTFVKNPYSLFNKIEYDDSKLTLEDITAINFDHLKDTYVKVIVVAKNNPYWFDLFIGNLEKVGLADLQVTDDHMNLDVDEDDYLLGEDVETTVLILKQAAQQVGEYHELISTEEMSNFLTTLYNEALFVE